MTWKLLSPAEHPGGVAHYTREDGNGSIDILSVQDTGALLEANKARYNDGDGYSKDRTWRRAAEVPNVVIQKWLQEDGIDFWNPDHAKAVRAKLNSSEYLYLRTAPGRL